MLTNMNDSREQQLEKLKSFIDTVNEEVTNIVSTLGWTVESVTNVNKEYFKCPYDSSHWLTEASFNDHLTSCQWKAEGYGKLDVWLSEPTLPTDSPFCIKFDKQLQAQVLRMAKEQNPAMQIAGCECYILGAECMGERLVPRTSDRVVTDFTSDERRTLYDYVIANTTKPDIGDDITNINNLEPQQKEDKELSFLEILIQERNLKRRRTKHKGVHTNKRSHTEILREVINQQMEMYIDYISGQREHSEEKNYHGSRDRERQQSDSGYVMDVQSNKTNNLSYEKHRTERLYKIFHTSSRNYNDYSEERNFHHHEKKRDNQRTEHSEERTCHRSRDQNKQERYLNEIEKKHRHEHRKSSHSRERKSHKKDKHRSKNKHKDKYHEKKHKSRERDKSSERHYLKHKRKDKSTKY